jgi:hypothetical protein
LCGNCSVTGFVSGLNSNVAGDFFRWNRGFSTTLHEEDKFFAAKFQAKKSRRFFGGAGFSPKSREPSAGKGRGVLSIAGFIRVGLSVCESDSGTRTRQTASL